MFRTKQDVDRHATNVLGRIKNEKEKNSRGYQIGRLYFDVGEYETAKRYLSSFLSVRETVPQAHKLMGHIYLKTSQKENALECYKRSLELDATQKDLIIKICELCTQVPMNPERARFWLEKAEMTCPGNEVIFRLREMMAQCSGDEDFQGLENLLTSEIKQRPGDVSLRIKLLNLYLKSGKVDQAYDISQKIDRTMDFSDTLEWYETLNDICQEYKSVKNCQGDLRFYTNLLSCLRSVVYLRLCYREPMACGEVLHQFDQSLQEGVQIPLQNEEWKAFLTEMYGQFYFLSGTLLLKRAQKGNLSWKDVIPLSSVCYLLNNSIIHIDSRAEWFVAAGKEKTFQQLLMNSMFRKSQGGHTLQALGRGDTNTWTQKLRQQYCTPQGRDKLYDTLFTQPGMRNKKGSSYLMNTPTFTESLLLFPTRGQLRIFDTGCYRLHPSSLTSLVWLALQRYSCKDKAQPYYGFDLFDNMQFNVKNMSTGGAESLCQLDTDVFLYASVRCAALKQQELIHMGHTDPAQPDYLPLCLTKPLCSQEQADWWMAAYKFYTNSVRDNFSKMRHLLQRGIETVRLLGSHGMSVNLVVHVARSLEAKGSEVKQLGSEFQQKAEMIEVRTVYYWEQALEMLERLEKNRMLPVTKQRLFKDDSDTELDASAMKVLMSEAQYAIGMAAMKEERYEESIHIFEKLDNPFASFNMAKIYKLLAEQERSRDAPVGREQYQILLTRARDAIFQTMDRLQGDKKHELNRSIEHHLDDIESQLQCATVFPEADIEEEEEEPSQYHTPTAGRSVSRNASQSEADSTLNRSTPREKGKSPAAHVSFNTSDTSRHVRPSPERLDAQIRSLAYSQESLVKMVLARNEELVKINCQLVEGLRENRELITQLKAQLNMSQKYNFSGLSTPGPHMGSPYQPAYPPHQAMPPAAAPGHFGYQMPSPAGMAGYRPQSPRPRSRTNLMGHSGFTGKPEEASGLEGGEEEDENPYFIDGEYFDESLAHGQYLVPDSNLIQEWPYGHRAGIEGNSTVTYAPQNMPQMPQTGYFASSLRGQALQFSGQSNIPAAIPGPGYFSSPHGLPVSSALTQTPSLVAAIMGKDSPKGAGVLPVQATSGMQAPTGHMMQQFINQAISQPQPATSLAAQMAQKSGFTAGNFGAGIKTASTPLAKPAAAGQSPNQSQQAMLGQMTQTQAQNLVNRSTASSVSPTAAATEVVCLFQGKATYTSKVGSKQEGNVKVFYLGAEKGGRVRMDTLTSNQIILNHDITTLKLVPSFTPQLVTWKRPQPDGKGEDMVNLNFDSAEIGQKLKTVIQKIQDAGKKVSEAQKPATATSSPFSLPQGSPAFKPTASQAVPASTPFGQATTPAASTAAASTPTSQAQEQDKSLTSNVPKSSFGGLTFSTTPMIKPPEDKPKTSPTAVKLKESSLKVTSPSATPEAGAAQPKPFAGFTFTPTKPVSQPSPAPASTGKKAGESSPAFMLGQNTGSPIANLSKLVAGGYESSFNTSTALGFKNISQAGSPRKGDDDERVEEYEPNVDFKPVIDLPDLVELKTGEEDEEKVFGERAKLFRFDTNSSQWKERGVGEMKILFNKDTRKYRILMRRDQVLKICANHNISKEMKLTPMVRSDRAWCWSAMDFADEEMNMEKLAVKFKSPELATKFKDCFETCQKKMETQSKPEAIGSTEVAEKQDNKDKSLSEMFKPKAGSWECPTCCCQNEGDKLKCPACNTVKPGAEDEVKKAELANMPAPGSMAGFKIGGGSGFKTGGGTSFGFGVGSRAGVGAGAGAGAGGFSFGSPAGGSGGFSFMQKPAQDKPQDNKVSSSVPEVEAKETSKDSIKGTSKETPKDTPKGPQKSLAEMFKPKEGAWECPGCMCNNDATHVKCPACKTVKPGAKPEDIKSEAAATAPPSLAGFKLGGGAGGFSFASKPSTPATPTKEEKKPAATGATKSLLAEMLQTKDTPEKTVASAQPSGFSFTPKSGLNFGAATTPQKSGGFNFGTPAEAEKKETASSGFNFGTPAADSTKKEGFQFNLGKVSTPVKATEGAKTDTSNFQFTFSLTPSKSPQAKSPQAPKSPDDGYYVNKEDDDSHIYFEPIISLPEKVDLKTGEEEEICHFEQRAKLFRFHDKEWKERGLGTMKILEHKETHRRRLLMRREQILKICCNHIINPELELKPMTTGGECKAWVWFAQDFADEEPKMENFAIRFKTKEIADQFKKEFDAAKALAAGSEPKSEAATGSAAGAVSKKTSEKEVEQQMTASVSHASGDKGNHYHKEDLDKLVLEEKMSSENIQESGDIGNPLYSAKLDASVEPSFTFTSTQGTGDKGNPYYKSQLEKSVVSESMISSTTVEGTGDHGNPLYIEELNRLVDEPDLTSTSYQISGDKGNPQYRSQLDELAGDIEPRLKSSSSGNTGDRGNQYYTQELDKSIEPQITSTIHQGTGDKGNKYFTELLDRSVEPQMTRMSVGVTGDKGNQSYTKELDMSVEPQMTSSTFQGTGNKGNKYFSQELDKLAGEPQMTQAIFQGTGDRGNTYYSEKLDHTGSRLAYRSPGSDDLVEEYVIVNTVNQECGFNGNPQYASELNQLVDESLINPSAFQGTGNHGNRYYSSELDANDLSGVEYLFTEEATEEQKAEARKYQLPDNFYLYLKKPPCPGCIGCEDQTKPFTPSKPKSKAKSETTSPAASQVTAQASISDTDGASAGGNYTMFGQSTGPSFSVLAAQGDATGFSFKKDESKPFHWSGAGRPLFGMSSPGQNTGDEDEVLPSEDVDFKPIVHLDLVEIKSGEEGWDVIYNQRSKLFRFDKKTNQWKERAVGEMKIMKQDDKYRLLMRRDQVHKVACNHLLSPAIKMEPMATSETAWCWIAQDYAENEPQMEQFALRFKTQELAKTFKQKVEECLEEIKKLPPAVNKSNNSSKEEATPTQEAPQEEDEEEEEEEEDSEEENITIFEKRATLFSFENNEWKKLGLGDLKIMYNEDLNGNNVEMQTDEGTRICNHVICREHTISLDKKARCSMWSPIDFSTDDPVRRHFKAVFSSVAAAEEFVKTFNQGAHLAHDSELSEKISHEMDTPEVFSRGDAASFKVGRKYFLQLFNFFVYIALAVTGPDTVSGVELIDSGPVLSSNLPIFPAKPPGQSQSNISQSGASGIGENQSERTKLGENGGSQSAASLHKGNVLVANQSHLLGSCSPEITAMLDSMLAEDQKK